MMPSLILPIRPEGGGTLTRPDRQTDKTIEGPKEDRFEDMLLTLQDQNLSQDISPRFSLVSGSSLQSFREKTALETTDPEKAITKARPNPDQSASTPEKKEIPGTGEAPGEKTQGNPSSNRADANGQGEETAALESSYAQSKLSHGDGNGEGAGKGVGENLITLVSDTSIEAAAPVGLIKAQAQGTTVSGSKSQDQITEQKIIQQVAQTLSLKRLDIRKGGEGVILKLEPKEFGALKIEVRTNQEMVSAEITTQHPHVREILEKNQSLLEDALSRLGLRVDQFSVNVGDFGNRMDSPNDGWRDDELDAGYTVSPLLGAVEEALRYRYSEQSNISVYV